MHKYLDHGLVQGTFFTIVITATTLERLIRGVGTNA